MRNDSRLAFVVFGSRLPRDMERQVIKEKNDQILDMKVWIDEVAPVFDEPYAPPEVLQAPHISLVWARQANPLGAARPRLVRLP